MARVAKTRTRAKETGARASTEKTASKTRTPATKPASRRPARKRAGKLDLDKELSVENLLARGEALEAERLERAAREAETARPVRSPVPIRPSNPVHWGYGFCFDAAIPAAERDPLIQFFARFTEVSDDPSAGFFIVGPDTGPEVRRAAWDAGALVLELEQLRAQLPPDDFAARSERLARVLARPTGEAWHEAAMLLSTWDEATLPDAIAGAERLLAAWPDEMRTRINAWDARPELRRLVRVQAGPLDPDGPAPGVTVLFTQDADGLQKYQHCFSAITTLDISGQPDLPALVAECTDLVGLERLRLHQPTYTGGTATLDLARLLAAPHLQRLTGLSLYGYKLSDADLDALAECPQPLEHLRLEYAQMKPAAGAQLARLAARTRLRTLQLKYNDLGPKGAAALFADRDAWRALRVLDISANEIGDRGVEALARAALDELRWLSLSSNDNKNQLGPRAARALAGAPALANLEMLFLHGHPIGAEGVAALLHSPHLRSLRGLNVGFPNTTLDELVAACAGAGEPVPLTELNLGYLGASTTPSCDLRHATFLRTVRFLGLDGLDGADYSAVLSCPHLESLEVLILGGGFSNQPAAFAALCSAEPPPRLRYLGLSGWKFSPEQAEEFAASPLGRRLWGLELMTSYTVPEAWYALYRAGLPLAKSPLYDAHAPSEYTITTNFREEL